MDVHHSSQYTTSSPHKDRPRDRTRVSRATHGRRDANQGLALALDTASPSPPRIPLGQSPTANPHRIRVATHNPQEQVRSAVGQVAIGDGRSGHGLAVDGPGEHEFALIEDRPADARVGGKEKVRLRESDVPIEAAGGTDGADVGAVPGRERPVGQDRASPEPMVLADAGHIAARTVPLRTTSAKFHSGCEKGKIGPMGTGRADVRL